MTGTSVASCTLVIVDNPFTQPSLARINYVDKYNYVAKYTFMDYVCNSLDSYMHAGL